MNRKELKNISRKELLELLLAQTTRIEELEKELEKANKKLSDKRIALNEAGNLAEASLKITNLFSVTEEACKIYKDNYEAQVKKEYEKIEKKRLTETEKLCKKKIDTVNSQLEASKLELKEIRKEIREARDMQNREKSKLKEKKSKPKDITSKDSKEVRRNISSKKDRLRIKVNSLI